MITDTVCAESPVIRAISDLASGPCRRTEAQHQPLVLRAHAGLIRAPLQRRTAVSSRVRSALSGRIAPPVPVRFVAGGRLA